MKEKDSQDFPKGTIFEILREYLGASSKKLELEFEKSQEQFRLSTEKFDRERERSQEQLRTSSEKFVRQMEESQEHLRHSSEKFLQKMEKSQEHFKWNTENQQEEPGQRTVKGQKNEDGKIIKNSGENFVKLAGNLKVFDIREKFNEMGFFFTEQSLNKQIREHDNPNAVTGIDILLENDDLVIAIEVKSKPNQSDVDEHVKRIEVLRRIALRRKDSREYRGAFAGTASQQIRDYILEKGFLLIEKTGNMVKISG